MRCPLREEERVVTHGLAAAPMMRGEGDAKIDSQVGDEVLPVTGALDAGEHHLGALHDHHIPRHQRFTQVSTDSPPGSADGRLKDVFLLSINSSESVTNGEEETCRRDAP